MHRQFLAKVFCIAFLFVLWSGLGTNPVYALQTITLTEGQSAFVNISQEDLNLIKFPSSDIRVYTSSKAIDLKIDGRNVFVNVLNNTVDPQEVFFVTPLGTYSLILVPKAVPAETIVVRMPEEDIHDALQWERSHDYVTGLKELVKAMYAETPPMGFAVKSVDKEVPRWKEVRQVLVSLYAGATLEGEVYRITNISDKPIRMLESEFYQKGVLAVSMDRHELSPGKETLVYIVKRSESQRRIDQILRRHNPLDVLRAR